MKDSGSVQYLEDLKFGEAREEIIEEFLRKRKDRVVEKYISYDEDGGVVWQNIVTKYGRLRHPDFRVFDSSGEMIILIEVKSLKSEYSNELGLATGIPKNDDEIYLTVEKEKFDDYVLVQSHYECECRIVFVVGDGNKDKNFYWGTLDDMKKSILSECKPYGKKRDTCYLWSIFDLNWGLDDII